MCGLWRQNCHSSDSYDVRDLPGLRLIQVSVISTLCPPQKWDFFPFYSSFTNKTKQVVWKQMTLIIILAIVWCTKWALELEIPEREHFNLAGRLSKHLLHPTQKLYFLMFHWANRGSNCWFLEGQPLPFVFSLKTLQVLVIVWFLSPAECRPSHPSEVAVSTGISIGVVVEMEVTRCPFLPSKLPINVSLTYCSWFLMAWGRQCHNQCWCVDEQQLLAPPANANQSLSLIYFRLLQPWQHF